MRANERALDLNLVCGSLKKKKKVSEGQHEAVQHLHLRLKLKFH